MRLDLFLKLSRLCPRRTVAQKLCDAGIVLLNGRAAKSAHDVKAGDEIIIRKANEETVARVLEVPTSHNVSRRDANSLIQIVSRTAADDLTWA
ncbi:MAG: S4 domain-containing protein [Pyrinomonadaceae bacterium]